MSFQCVAHFDNFLRKHKKAGRNSKYLIISKAKPVWLCEPIPVQ